MKTAKKLITMMENVPAVRITFAEDEKTPCHTFILDNVEDIIKVAAEYVFLSGVVAQGLYKRPLEDFFGRSSSVDDPRYEKDGSYYGPLCVEFYLGQDEWYEGGYHGAYSLRFVKQDGKWECLRREDTSMEGLDDKVWEKANEMINEFVKMVEAAENKKEE